MTFGPIEIALPDWVESALPGNDAIFSTDEERMRVAISLARGNVEHGTGGPFGAAIFDGQGRFVAPGVNLVMLRNNCMLHAEAVAIMLAQRDVNNYDLSAGGARFELYSSIEPCAMCLGAVHWSGVKRLICGGRDEDARSIGFDEGPKPPEGILVLQRSGLQITRDLLRPEALAVLRRYVELGGVIY